MTQFNLHQCDLLVGWASEKSDNCLWSY